MSQPLGKCRSWWRPTGSLARPLFQSIALLYVLIGLGEAQGAAGTVQLEWDPVVDSRLAYYEVHYGTASGQYAAKVQVTDTTTAVGGLEPGTTYYFAARACALSGSLCSELSNEVSASVPYSAPVAGFVADKTSGLAPFDVSFANESSGPISTWTWDFGDGEGSADPTPAHTYTVPGSYTVTLTVAGPGGSDTRTVTSYIQVMSPPPVAGFDATNRSGFAPLTVAFSDRSAGEVTALSWSFGDGVLGSGEDAVYTYVTPGLYTVSLSASGPGGTHTEVKTDYIEVKHPAPVANFVGDVLQGPAPLQVAFQNLSTGRADVSAWDFGDGSASNETHPVHTYTKPGIYAVTLSVSNQSGSDSMERVSYVRVDGDELPMEIGEVSIDHRWKRVSFSKPFTDPIVVAKPASYNGSSATEIRIEGVDALGFQIRLAEWDYLDGRHSAESVTYIAVERGAHELPGGVRVEAGRLETDATNDYVRRTFDTPFPEAPVVFASVTSVHEVQTVAIRMRNVTGEGFDVGMQEQEANEQKHLSETIDYVAWERSYGTIDGVHYEVGLSEAGVTHKPYALAYRTAFLTAPLLLADMQTTASADPASLRWKNRNEVSVEVWVAEEKSKDSEIGHVAESLGYFVAEEVQ